MGAPLYMNIRLLMTYLFQLLKVYRVSRGRAAHYIIMSLFLATAYVIYYRGVDTKLIVGRAWGLVFMGNYSQRGQMKSVSIWFLKGGGGFSLQKSNIYVIVRNNYDITFICICNNFGLQ